MPDCLMAQAALCPALRAGGWRSTRRREDEPGGRLQPGCEATAGLACVCPDRRTPARPLMGKACGQTSGSGTGNTQSIIRASGFLHCLAPAGPECRCLPCRPPGTRRSGEEECPARAMWEGQQGGLEPQQDLPMDTTARAALAGRGGRTRRDSGSWQHTQRGGCSPWAISSISRRCWHSPGITCLREAGSRQSGYSTGAA